MGAYRNNAGETYECWYEDKKRILDKNESWERIGEWAYPNKNNGSFSYIFCHLCETSWKREESHNAMYMKEDMCDVCGAEVPDGIKMIALLEML